MSTATAGQWKVKLAPLASLLRGEPSESHLRKMSDKELTGFINYDAEDGRINTPYSREYDRRTGRTK